MRFNVSDWLEVENGTLMITAGRARVRTTKESIFYLDDGVDNVMCAYGYEMDLTLTETVELTVEPVIGERGRVFLYAPRRPVMVPSGEVYTNIDRKPHESGSVLEIRREMRRFALHQQAMRTEMREERDRLLQTMAESDPKKASQDQLTAEESGENAETMAVSE